jgi:molecular chaperone GrpE
MRSKEDTTNKTPDAAEQGTSPVGASDELTKCRQERDDLFERLARSTAEYQNSRKRLDAETEQRLQYANSSLIKSLIPVIDNFERALAVDPAKSDVTSILKGLHLVHDQWLAVLKKEHVETIAPEPGTPFDPTRHEALLHQHSDKYDGPTVTQLLTKGYALHGRTLRPASVAVSEKQSG